MMPRKPKPLEWYSAGVEGIGVGGQLPKCAKCCDLLFKRGFAEAVSSAAIEHPTSPAAGDLARRIIEDYHQRRHRVG